MRPFICALILIPVIMLAGCASTAPDPIIAGSDDGARAEPAALFSPEYQAANRGRIQVLVPEVYEMVNVAIALTDNAAANPGRVSRSNDYYPRVLAHFENMRGHAFVRDLNARLEQGGIPEYIRLKLNAIAFDFDARGRIVRSSVYNRALEEEPDNALAPLLAEMQAFANASGFRNFYAANGEVYRTQTAFLREETDASGMWTWLRERFPGVRAYDGVKIIISPLAGDIQNLVTFESNGYREMQPHINFPYNLNPNLSAQGNSVWRGTLLFGEMNHGFINPTADAYRAEIDDAIYERTLWATEESAAIYSDDYELFNEYMNFGLITLYHHDRMNEADALVAQQRIDSVMVEGRGFKKFAEFDAFLLDLYAHRRPDEPIADLYPRIIDWFSAQSSAGRRIQ